MTKGNSRLDRLANYIENWAVFRLFRVIELVAVFAALVAFYLELQNRSVDRAVRIATLYAQIAQTLQVEGGKEAVAPSVVALVSEEVPLRGLNLSEAILTGLSLAGSDLSDANLSGAKLEGVDFTGAILIGTNFRGAELDFALFEGADLAFAQFEDSDLTGARFINSALNRADFRDATGIDVVIKDSDVTGANFHGSTIGLTNSGSNCYTQSRPKGFPDVDLSECGDRFRNRWETEVIRHPPIRATIPDSADEASDD